MKKRSIVLIMLLSFVVAAIAIGCGASSATNQASSATKSMVLRALTDRDSNSGTGAVYLQGYGCSNSSISNIGTVSLTFPDDNTYDMQMNTGYIVGSHYYVGNSTTNLGEMRDPLTESTQRQFVTGAIIPNTDIDGTYAGKMGDKTKDFSFSQTSFMLELNENDVTTQAGTGRLNVTTGDTITLSNQNTSGYRYFCVVYNNFQGSNTYDNIWASIDITDIDWVNTDTMASFFQTQAKAPTNGSVSFIVPGGVMLPDTETLVLIFAVNSSTVDSDTSGSFRTLVYAESILRMVVQTQ
ncbi:MAG: hypothetical protein K8T10_09085 [Candidatus Eremiobacteraeota bacterium]|nr:hypothetical protein [Candidatus Eremiobacteraeota bacterium]